MSGTDEDDDIAESDNGSITDPDKLDVIKINCSNCLKLLSEYAITNPNLDETWKIKILCPYCKDHSYTINIKGKFYIAPAEELVYIDTEYVNNMMVFKTQIK